MKPAPPLTKETAKVITRQIHQGVDERLLDIGWRDHQKPTEIIQGKMQTGEGLLDAHIDLRAQVLKNKAIAA